jgi:hypothetical protein
MSKLFGLTTAVVLAVACAPLAAAQPVAEPASAAANSVKSDPFVLGPPPGEGPVVVKAGFELSELNEINDEEETFAFTGILTLQWRDERQAFDPAGGVSEKIYQGSFQFDEISPGWFPQVVLVNSVGSYNKEGTVLRVQPDGTSTLIEKVSAVAKSELNLRRFPFDKQRLEAVFEVLGFDKDEVRLEPISAASRSAVGEISIPQWKILDVTMSTRDRPVSDGITEGARSAFVTSIEAERESFYVSRLVTMPLFVIVLLSFSVFWMDKSSLGDRMSVSFIGILSAVAYQVVMSEILPKIAYVTWMNAFLNFSFLTMVGTVLVNLCVGVLDQRGRTALADRIDRVSRWAFPLIYFGLILFAFAVAFFVF